jgi:hypothetical protein
MRRTDRSGYTTRKFRLGEEPVEEVDPLDATRRIEMVWQLTLQAWAFRGHDGEQDFAEMLGGLSAAGAEYLVIGAHAVGVYATPRATGDLDIWVRAVPGNAERVWKALEDFGAPLHRLTKNDLHSDDVVFQIGVAPNRIDILATIGGVEFGHALDLARFSGHPTAPHLLAAPHSATSVPT